MYYLENGLSEKGPAWGVLGRVLAIVFAVLTIGGSLGGGNMFQANQTLEILSTVSPVFREYNWVVGIVLAAFVALVIIGGIRRIGQVTSRIVPFMCVLYVLTCLLIVLSHATLIPEVLAKIVSDAFSGPALYGGFVGVLVMGIRRASFSNSRLPRSMLRARSSTCSTCRIRFRAREVETNASQSRLGLCPFCVTTSTMSPFCSVVLSGTILPFTRAPTHWCPTSV